MKRFAAEFAGIEVVYWTDETGRTKGEAYFKEDDFCAPILNGEFAHPQSGQQYKLHIPSQYGKSKDAILDVLSWRQVGRMVPVACP